MLNKGSECSLRGVDVYTVPPPHVTYHNWCCTTSGVAPQLVLHHNWCCTTTGAAPQLVHHNWCCTTTGAAPQLVLHHNWRCTTTGAAPQLVLHHNWCCTTTGAAAPQLALHHNWCCTTTGAAPQLVLHHNWCCTTTGCTTTGVAPQLALHHNWCCTTTGAAPQLVLHHNWCCTTTGAAPQLALHHNWCRTTTGSPDCEHNGTIKATTRGKEPVYRSKSPPTLPPTRPLPPVQPQLLHKVTRDVEADIRPAASPVVFTLSLSGSDAASASNIMRSLVVLSVVVGVAFGQIYPRDTPEVAEARQRFIEEYNRLAILAAEAPDIHIYHEQPRSQLVTDTLPRERVDTLRGVVTDSRRQQQAFAPRPIQPPVFNSFSYTVDLGSGKEFNPSPNTFPTIVGHPTTHPSSTPQRATHRFAPVRAPTFAPVRAPTFAPVRAPTFAPVRAPTFNLNRASTYNPDPAPTPRWKGPLADTEPAGIHGQVQDTHDVATMKATHFRAVADALQAQGHNIRA
ncbi:uncharacterized protein LOC121871716 [Homarus americanus]|uniref:uncharacterized protein LOC121871716 n=1 Tax=Homarus americanus TaxID=6706 RepID=UPI001C48168F|nr:uncharacterized protein LOC121871716 [Homarus americanus]